jgi:hypothetical protein
MASVGGCVPFLTADAGFSGSLGGCTDLAVLCSDLACPKAIGEACLLALPAAESAPSSLARAILADLRPTGRSRSLPNVLARAMIERSRADYCEGRVVTVDGWILSLTETRIYALATLRSERYVAVA